MAKRVTLTKAQASSPFGQSLISFFHSAAEDRRLSIDEVRRLDTLLRGAPGDVAAVEFLGQLTTAILFDGVLDDLEAFQLRMAIERVVPLSDRRVIQQKLASIERPAPVRYESVNDSDDDLELDDEPATERQLAYIRDLGGTAPPGLGKWAASELIDKLKICPSPRQIMVLRFWGRLDLASGSRKDVSAWMDRFYAEDERRLLAWERFKVQVGDDGRQCDPSCVPLGVGPQYLAQVAGAAVIHRTLTVVGIIVAFVAFLLVVVAVR